MAEERTAKLKLKRKKCTTTVQGAQETETKLQSLPVVDLRQSSSGSWFDEIELTTAEQQWKRVLTCVSPDLGSVGWGSVPGLPHFSCQVAGQEQMKTTVEVFRVGHQSFEWFPFPTALPPTVTEEPCTTDFQYKTSQRNEELAEQALPKSGIKSHPSLNEVTHSEMSMMVQDSEGTCKNSTIHHTELQCGVAINLKEPNSLQKSSAKDDKSPLTSQKSSTKTFKVPQNLKKGSADSIKEPETSKKRTKKSNPGLQLSQKGSAKTAKEPQTLPKQTAQLWPTVTLAKKSKAKEEPKRPEPAAQTVSESNDVIMDHEEEPVSELGGRQQVVQENVAQTKAAESLQNCPICLMQFPKQFSQLDMDSHLAQCLSETTVDVVW